jgi:hypothetical protein
MARKKNNVKDEESDDVESSEDPIEKKIKS